MPFVNQSNALPNNKAIQVILKRMFISTTGANNLYYHCKTYLTYSPQNQYRSPKAIILGSMSTIHTNNLKAPCINQFQSKCHCNLDFRHWPQSLFIMCNHMKYEQQATSRYHDIFQSKATVTLTSDPKHDSGHIHMGEA